MQSIPITIDNNSGIPLWLQLRNRLIYLITSGHFRKGEQLPTVRNLAVELGINFNTVSKVYRDIERDGYIISRQGAGSFVSDEYLNRVDVAFTDTYLLIDEFIRECLEIGVPRDDIAGLVIERLMMTDNTQEIKKNGILNNISNQSETRISNEQEENHEARAIRANTSIDTATIRKHRA